MIAGDRDDLVPLSLSRRLYDAAVEPKRFVLSQAPDTTTPGCSTAAT